MSIARIASLPSLQAAQVRSVTAIGAKSTSRGQRTSFESRQSLSRSQSRSEHDLRRLDSDVAPASAHPSRPTSPAPLFVLNEQHSVHVDEMLGDMGLLDQSLMANWASLIMADAEPAAAECILDTLAAEVAAEAVLPEAALPLEVSLSPSTPDLEPLPITPVKKEAPLLHIYKTTMTFSYLQEMMNNLKHVKSLASQCVEDVGGSAAASAASAARFLSRSLGRAVNRVRTQAKQADLMLTTDSLVTLQEYGYAEVATLSEEEAKELSMMEMEAHNLETGVVMRFNRISVDDPWFLIGTAPTSVRCIRQTLGGAVPDKLAAMVRDLFPAPGLSINALCQSLQQAADSVMAAANTLAELGAGNHNKGGAANAGVEPAPLMACV